MGVPSNALDTGVEEEGKGGFNWEALETPKDGLVEAETLNGSEGEALHEAPYSLFCSSSKFALGQPPASVGAGKELVPALTTPVFPWLKKPCPQRCDPSDRLHRTSLLCS